MVGCIPSKALLHAAKVIDETQEMAGHRIAFGVPTLDIDKLRSWKDGIIKKLDGRPVGSCQAALVTVRNGVGTFLSPKSLRAKTADGDKTILFDHAIIAFGSEPIKLRSAGHRFTGALELNGLPKRLLVLGEDREMATV